jgi:tetrahydromethanopterin S-methyltransferase subunit F
MLEVVFDVKTVSGTVAGLMAVTAFTGLIIGFTIKKLMMLIVHQR